MSRAIVYAEWWWTCDYCGATCEEPYDSEPEALLASDEHECETETQRDHDRRELAERFANQRQTRTGAINELAALLDAEDELDRLAAEAIETARTEDFVISGRIRID